MIRSSSVGQHLPEHVFGSGKISGFTLSGCFVETGAGCLSIVRSDRLAERQAGGRVARTLAAVVTFVLGLSNQMFSDRTWLGNFLLWLVALSTN